jgi:hypothetical protein
MLVLMSLATELKLGSEFIEWAFDEYCRSSYAAHLQSLGAARPLADVAVPLSSHLIH